MPARSKDWRLWLYVLLGLLAGGAFVVFDLMSESRLSEGTLHGGLHHAHNIVDHVLPLVAGAMFGVCGHYFRLRSQLSDAEALAARTEALRSRLQKVERDQAVWVLAAAVLHELNNPLHALGLLLDEVANEGNDEATRRELLARATAQSERALATLRRLRSLRSVEEPRVVPIDLDGAVAALAADAGALAREDGLQVRIERSGPIRANVDPSYLRTIVENLIQNSLQALRSRGSGEVKLALSAEDGRAVLRVSDDGPPLDATVASTIFTPLNSTKHNGLGLGLPIARALARAMHGDLHLDESDRKTFRLEMPLGGVS